MNVVFCTGTWKEMINTHEIHNINDVSLFLKKLSFFHMGHIYRMHVFLRNILYKMIKIFKIKNK